MIKSWNIRNFKSIAEESKLEFSPLTIFVGANSSGKSTIIQSLLIAIQTMQSQVQARSVVLNGHIVRLGSFEDIVSNFDKNGDITIGFEIEPNFFSKEYPGLIYSRRYFRSNIEEVNKIFYEFSFSSHGISSDKTELLQLQPKLKYCNLQLEWNDEKGAKKEVIKITRSKEDVKARIANLGFHENVRMPLPTSALEYEIETDENVNFASELYYRYPKTGELVGCYFRHFIPYLYCIFYDVVAEQADYLVRYLVQPGINSYRYGGQEVDGNLRFGNNLQDFINQKISEILTDAPNWESHQVKVTELNRYAAKLKKKFDWKDLRTFMEHCPPAVKADLSEWAKANEEKIKSLYREDKVPNPQLTSLPLSNNADTACDFLYNFFHSQVKYLGPLRDEPKPIYPIAGNIDPFEIGFKGENTAAVLDLHKDLLIQYVKSSDFLENNLEIKPVETKLLDAVSDWLIFMGVGIKIKTDDKGKFGHELKINTVDSSEMHDLTHVGVGVSQILPILVQALIAEPGSTLIFEQPELHLNPRVQTRLADFFLSMSYIGKQCIIETHSEYLINRLRQRAAVLKGDEVADKVIIYFVEKKGGKSKYSPIKMNSYGKFDHWPEGFFDEAEKLAAETLRAALKKKEDR
ncbi:AAA family ATPase [Leptospira andrefontaineae]|uniref:DUF3696 domain-containing protein n=1 Tax=Leptospira andrefontaineae TaxID=2484976 RepID=A0A4R9H6P7_9LEPT|nr:DUF3696 domain-containing protein [Leptospira andrefontaineae]TGK41273.1 DUF3696 domain-containing protein [Leptospira andrefontaineae]